MREIPQDMLWGVNITGPDDVIAASSRAEAIQMASRFNNWWSKKFGVNPHPYDHLRWTPLSWAVPRLWIGSSERHRTALADLGEYAWLKTAYTAGDDDTGES